MVKPEGVVLLGATAAKALLGSSFRVTRHRGELLDSELAEIVAATIHPSAILRQRVRTSAWPSAGLRGRLTVAWWRALEGPTRRERCLSYRPTVNKRRGAHGRRRTAQQAVLFSLAPRPGSST